MGGGGGRVVGSTSTSALAQILPRGGELTSGLAVVVVGCQSPRRGGGMADPHMGARDEIHAVDGRNQRWRVKMMPCFGENRSWADGTLMLRIDVHRAVLMNYGDLVVDA